MRENNFLRKLVVFHFGYIMSGAFDVIVLGYLALKFSHNPNEVIKVFTSGFVARILLIYISGYIIDCYSKKSILFVSSIVRSITLLVAGIMSLMGLLDIFTLSILAVLLMGAKQFYSTSIRTLAKIISKEKVSTTHYMLSISANFAGIFAPIIAGIFLKFNLESYLFFLASLINIIILIPLIRFKYREKVQAKVNLLKTHHEFIKAFKYIRKSGALFYFAIMSFFIFGLFVRNAALVGFLHEQLKINAFEISIFFGVSCTGAIFGSILVNKFLKKYLKIEKILIFGTLLEGVFYILFSYFNNFYLELINIFLISTFFVLWIEFQSIAQVLSKKEYLAKASSIAQFLSFGMSIIFLELFKFLSFSFQDMLFGVGIIYVILGIFLFFYKFNSEHHKLGA